MWIQVKQRKEVLQRIQEATSLRHMHGIPTGRRAADWTLNEGRGGELPSPEVFDENYDPLAGTEPAAAMAGPTSTAPNVKAPATAPSQPAFSAQTSSPARAGASLIDDLFASEPEPLPEPSP